VPFGFRLIGLGWLDVLDHVDGHVIEHNGVLTVEFSLEKILGVIAPLLREF
jgi:hypothetical protein